MGINHELITKINTTLIPNAKIDQKLHAESRQCEIEFPIKLTSN